MNFFKRLLGRDHKFFDLLEASAEEAYASAKILSSLMSKLGNERDMQESIEISKRERVGQKIASEREGVEYLPVSLSPLPQTIEKTGEAGEADNDVKILDSLMPRLEDVPAVLECIELLAQSRRKHKQITQEITTQLCRTFVTPLEREDIKSLSCSLSRIPKTMEKIGERLLICPLNSHAESMTKQLVMLEQAIAIVVVMVKSLKKSPHVQQIEDEYAELQTLEGDADRYMIALLREIFKGEADAKDAIFLKDMYELLEKAIDRCRDAGNVVFQIVLKYS